MASDIAKQVEQVIAPYAQKAGVSIAEIEFKKKSNGMNLTVFIYKDDGAVTINDCERLHKMIDAPLDELNPTNGKPYILNVSSLGLDRPLKTENDFKRNLGKEIEIKFFAPINGKKSIEGELVGYSDGIIDIKIQDEILHIEKRQTAKVSLKINF